jgi:hypothetical protein
MKRLFGLAIWLSLALILQAQDYQVETRRMTEEGLNTNQKFPVIAQNENGEQIYVYRAGDRNAHYFYYKNGKWGGGGQIPNSPTFNDYWFSDIVTDSEGTFHFICEDADKSLYYAYFKNGEWAPMRKVLVRHEATLALAVRSDDTLVLVSALKTVGKKGITKDVILGFKPKLATNFSNFVNITQDPESSTMVDVAVDAKDNTWVVYKGAFIEGGLETLQAVLVVRDKANKEIYWKNVSGHEYPAYCWYPTLSLDVDGNAMVSWELSQARLYYARYYNAATEKWSEIVPITTGPTQPWPTMYNKLISQGSDFYWIGVNGSRIVTLYKYNPDNNSWSHIADLSKVAANWCSACVAGEDLLVSWDSLAQPTACYLTTVSGIFPPPPIKVQSVSNLVVERKDERSFFHGYSFNVLTWEPNPINTEEEIIIAAHHVYRKDRTADSTQWTRIVVLAGNVYTYVDNNIPSDSDYVYAVTCVDSNGNESPIVEPAGQFSKTSSVSRPRITTSRSDRR